MTPLPADITDAELIAFTDGWATLLEAEDYQAAYNYTDHIREMQWTPELIRDAIKGYGDADPDQRVTVAGASTDVTQRKDVDRWPANAYGSVGEVWYDLNINGEVSDLTATLVLHEAEEGLTVQLNDIHVM